MSAVPVPDDLEPVIRENQREREAHEIELACEDMGHAWTKDAADGFHGPHGRCECGSRLYTITGELIEP